jgi:hypothetical protein
MKIILAALASLLAAFGKLLAKPINVALQIHIFIFAFLFIVFTLAGAYEFLMLLRRLMH